MMTLNFVMWQGPWTLYGCLIEVLTNSLGHYQKKLCVKSVLIAIFSGPFFSTFRHFSLNISTYAVRMRKI